ncbi:DUF2846 domain-containing protein [Flavobacterium pectinovorum]|uniref:DUF2846 domain-containing protein n=1 Tax=Flavobacterium pectinovorum TaxID=29533 RepID=UPI001FADAB66|nr:DUF2846 domain-containing protein [Flavobacterium pectinovorum]MCI9845288.1 hypothetical protein [Flavobacterium pectinovorum]
MKKILILAFAILSIVGYSQELRKPSEGKAIVYFVRSSGMGALINFKYFDGEKYLGKFNYGKYLVYECEPGKHVFWSRSENTDFIEADLEAGKIYIVDSEAQMGAIKAGVELVPFNPNPESYKTPKKFEKKKAAILKSISENKEYVATDSDLKEGAEEYASIIKKSTEKYNKLKEKSEEFAKVLPEMSYNN